MATTLIVACPHCGAPNRLPAHRLADRGNCGKCKQPLFLGEPVALTGPGCDAHFARSKLPLVVDFWAPWCAPCRAMAPAFAQAARELEPHVRLGKANTEEEPQLAARFGIRSIPTLVVFHHGRELGRQAGAIDAARLIRWVRSQLA